MCWSHWSFGVQTLAHTRPVYLPRWVFSKLLRPVKVYIGICWDAQQSPEINQPREIRDNRTGEVFSLKETRTHIYIFFFDRLDDLPRQISSNGWFDSRYRIVDKIQSFVQHRLQRRWEFYQVISKLWIFSRQKRNERSFCFEETRICFVIARRKGSGIG